MSKVAFIWGGDGCAFTFHAKRTGRSSKCYGLCVGHHFIGLVLSRIEGGVP